MARSASNGFKHANKFFKDVKGAKKTVKKILDKHRKKPAPAKTQTKHTQKPVIESTAFPDKLTLHYETHKARKRSKLIKTIAGNTKIDITTSGASVQNAGGIQWISYAGQILASRSDLNNAYVNATRQWNSTAGAVISSDPTVSKWNTQLLNISKMETHFRIMNEEPAVADLKIYFIVSTADQLFTATGIPPYEAWQTDCVATNEDYPAASKIAPETLDEVPHGPTFKKLYRIEKTYNVALGPGCVHHGKWVRNVNKIVHMDYVQNQQYFKGLTYWIMFVTQGALVNDALGYTAGNVTTGFTKISYLQQTKINCQAMSAMANGERQYNTLPVVGAASYVINPDTAAVVDIRVAANVG